MLGFAGLKPLAQTPPPTRNEAVHVHSLPFSLLYFRGPRNIYEVSGMFPLQRFRGLPNRLLGVSQMEYHRDHSTCFALERQ